MAKKMKNNFQPKKRNNYKTVVRMEEGGNVSELNYSERKEYIEQNYSPFITEAQMIFSIWDSGIEYDLKGDRKEVADSIIESYKSLGDYTEESLPKETVYEIQDWDLVRKDIDPETDEVIGQTSLTEVTADNTYNFSYLGLVDLNWRVYYDEEYEKYFYVIMPHLGGDIRGNYGDAIILEGSDKEELFYRYYEGFISGGASVYLKFKDGSEISFDSEQDSDVFYFRVSESFEPTGMAQKYLEDFEKFDSWRGDEFLEETIDIYLMRKGIAPKMMAGGRLDDETPSAYIQLLGYNEGKWIDLTDFSDGDDVIAHISDFMSELNAEFGGNREEYIFTDYEGFGRDMYDENMGSNEFDEILEGYEKYKDSDFPKEVITEYINDSGNSSMSLADVIDQMENNNLGKYDDYSDFGYNQVNQGHYSPTDNDVYVTDTDKRIMAGEESDNEASNMDFDALIERADNTRSEYEREKNSLEEEIAQVQDDIDSLNELKNSSDDGDDFDNISEQIEEKELELSDLEERLEDIDSRYEDDARNEVQEILYDEIYDRLENDLGSWLEDYGMTSELENISFLSVDYEKIGEELASDYLVVEYEGSIYIFSNFSKGGRIKASKTKTKYDFYIVENSTKKLVSGYSTKAEAVEQRKLLVEQYPAMRFEIYPLAKLETKTQLDVNAKKDYVELSTLDKIKKVSVDTLRYGQEKVGQAQMFLEKNDVKGKIKRGARKVADKTKQGANWLRGKWLEADFGDGTGRAKFFDDGGAVDGWEDLSYVKPNIIEISETFSFGNPDKLILKYNGKKIAQFYFNMRGYNSDFALKNSNGVHYGFGGDKSKSKQVSDFKKALKDGFIFIKKYYADGGELYRVNEDYAIKNENGWVLGYRGSSSEIYFSPHTMPITFPSEKLAQEFIDRNATKNPFIQKGIIVKLFADGGGVGDDIYAYFAHNYMGYQLVESAVMGEVYDGKIIDVITENNTKKYVLKFENGETKKLSQNMFNDYIYTNKKFSKGGGVGDSEIKIAILYGKMLNELNKEKQFNKKIEKKSLLDKFSKSNGLTIDHNNIIYVNGVKLAYIDKINQKTGQEKSNWEIKRYADGGGVGIGSTFESENDSLNTFKGYNNYFCIEFNGKVLHSVKTKSQHLKKLNELVDKYNLTEIKQKNSEFDDGGGVHTMPNGEVMLNSAHYKNGGGVMSDGRFKLRGFPPIDKFELMELYYDFQENFSSNIEKFTKHYNKVHDSKLRLIDVKELFDYAKLTFEPNGSKFDNGGYIKQDSWTNSGMGNLSVKETKQIAEKYAQALSTLYNQEFSVNPSVEENSFDLDIDGMAYEGGSYLIYGDGSVVNVAVNPNSRLGSTKSSINEIIGKIIDLKNQYGNAQFETLKRADGSVYGRKISSEIKYDDGGEVDNIKSDLNKYKNVDIRFKLIPNDGSEEDGDENDLSLNYVGEIYGGGIDSDEPFVELGFQVNDEQDETGNFNLKSDLNKYKNVDIRFKLIPNDGSEEDGDENDLSLNYVGEIYGGGIDSDEPFVELGFQVNDEYADGGEIKLSKKQKDEIKEHIADYYYNNELIDNYEEWEMDYMLEDKNGRIILKSGYAENDVMKKIIIYFELNNFSDIDLIDKEIQLYGDTILSDNYGDNDYDSVQDWQKNNFADGGGVDSKAEKLANTIRKDYQNGVVVQVNNDYGDSAYFSISAPFEYSLSKETAKEINKKYFNGKGEISGSGNEHYLNVNFDLDNFADGGGVWDKMTDEERKEYEKGKYIHYNIMNSRWQVWNGNESEEFWNQEQAEKFAGFEYDQDKDVRYSRNKYQYLSNGGGVGGERFNLSFNYNPSNISNEDAEKIVKQYTNDWKHNNDFDNVSFYVFNLTKEKADELKALLKMEDVFNIEIEKSSFADGGEVGNYELLKKIKKEFGNPPKGSDIRALKEGLVEVFYYSPNEDAKNWAMNVKNKFGAGRLPSSIQYNSAIIYVDTFKMADGGVSYEPMTKPVPTTKPKERTKPDKDNPYKPKGIPKPKASYDTGGAVDDYIDGIYQEYEKEIWNLIKNRRGSDYRITEYQGFLPIDENNNPLSDYQFLGQLFDRNNLLKVAEKYPNAVSITFHATQMGAISSSLESQKEQYAPIHNLAMTFDVDKLNQFADGGRVRISVLNELYNLRDKGVTQVQLNGFAENIGYVIGLRLDDTEIKKVGNNAYITLYKNGGGINDDSKFLNFKKQLIKYSDFNEKTGDGFSSRYIGLKNKKGDKSNGEYLIEGNEITWVYTDGEGNEYISDEVPELIIDLTGKKESFDNGGVSYEPMTKPVPTTKPKERTKPDKDNPYKPKGIPKPKATKM